MSDTAPSNDVLPHSGVHVLRGQPEQRPRLQHMLAGADQGVLLFSITPPRRSETEERIKEIAAVTLERLTTLDLDGLILYDIDDESDRNPDERPFPYLPALDPARYYAEHLGGWDRPTVIYRCVGKYHEHDLGDWLRHADPRRMLGVNRPGDLGDSDHCAPAGAAEALY